MKEQFLVSGEASQNLPTPDHSDKAPRLNSFLHLPVGCAVIQFKTITQDISHCNILLKNIKNAVSRYLTRVGKKKMIKTKLRNHLHESKEVKNFAGYKSFFNNFHSLLSANEHRELKHK